MPLRNKTLSLLALLTAAVAVAVGLVASRSIAFRPIDYGHYVEASALILRGSSPYGQVEFFAPPWLAFFMVPFLQLPATVAPIVWLGITALAVCGTTLVSSAWNGFPSHAKGRFVAAMVTGILPPAL